MEAADDDLGILAYGGFREGSPASDGDDQDEHEAGADGQQANQPLHADPMDLDEEQGNERGGGPPADDDAQLEELRLRKRAENEKKRGELIKEIKRLMMKHPRDVTVDPRNVIGIQLDRFDVEQLAHILENMQLQLQKSGPPTALEVATFISFGKACQAAVGEDLSTKFLQDKELLADWRDMTSYITVTAPSTLTFMARMVGYIMAAKFPDVGRIWNNITQTTATLGQEPITSVAPVSTSSREANVERQATPAETAPAAPAAGTTA